MMNTTNSETAAHLHWAHTRRHFLHSAGYGLGMAALGQLMAEESSPKAVSAATSDPLAPKTPNFPAKAKSCIFIFLEGGPSQIDLWDPKPKLNDLNGKPLQSR